MDIRFLRSDLSSSVKKIQTSIPSVHKPYNAAHIENYFKLTCISLCNFMHYSSTKRQE